MSEKGDQAFYLISLSNGTQFKRLMMQLPSRMVYMLYSQQKMNAENFLMTLYYNKIKPIIINDQLPENIKEQIGGLYLQHNLIIILGLVLPFFVFNTFIFYQMVFRVVPTIKSVFILRLFLYSALWITFCFYVVTKMFEPGKLNTKENKEEFEKLVKIRKSSSMYPIYQFQTCEQCQIPRVIRSHHCQQCKSCITKLECHSEIFNQCIGAGNFFLYVLFTFFYFLSCFLAQIFRFSAFFSSKNRNLPDIENPVGGLMKTFIFFVLLKMTISSCSNFLVAGIHLLYNMTEREMFYFNRTPYLWKDVKRNFFNPFDRGFLYNIRESIEPLIQNKMFEESNQKDGDIEANQAQRQFSKDYINWVEEKKLNTLDIPNSPLRLNFMKQLENKSIIFQNGKLIQRKNQSHQRSQQVSTPQHQHQHHKGCNHGMQANQQGIIRGKWVPNPSKSENRKPEQNTQMNHLHQQHQMHQTRPHVQLQIQNREVKVEEEIIENEQTESLIPKKQEEKENQNQQETPEKDIKIEIPESETPEQELQQEINIEQEEGDDEEFQVLNNFEEEQVGNWSVEPEGEWQVDDEIEELDTSNEINDDNPFSN